MKKICAKCKSEKNLSEFRKDIRYQLGVKSRCRKCEYAYTAEQARKKSLANKPLCANPKCRKKIGLGKIKYCSNRCYELVSNPIQWIKQKNTPGYREYHRKIAYNWAKKNNWGRIKI